MTLYVVELPPGGEDELTLRARRLLDQAALILAGRQAREQLEHLGMAGGARVLLPADVEPAGLVAAVQGATEGPVVWLVPGLAEWGEADCAALSAMLAAGVEVLPVPGGACWVGCLVASGLPSDRFTFLGQLPGHAASRRAQLLRFGAERHTLIWSLPAEALPAALLDTAQLLGDRNAALCSASEIWRGKLGDAPAVTADMVLIVEGAGEEPPWTQERVRERVRQCLAGGASARDVARGVADAAGWPRRRVYDIVLEVAAKEGG